MPLSLLDALAQKYPNAKRTTLRQMIEQGRVRFKGDPARRANQQVTDPSLVIVNERSKPASPSIEPLRIIHEDDDLLIVDKPPGLLTSTTPREKRLTAFALVRQYLAQSSPRSRPGLIHRLDRDASGLLVFSKSTRALASLKKQFADHSAQRQYLAVVHGRPTPPRGRIESRLTELTTGRVVSTKHPGKGQPAITDYEVLDQQPNHALLRLTLQTGRKHQIRAHLAERGWPIVGDELYGTPADGLKLRAVKLTLTHPRTHHQMTFNLPAPACVAEFTAPTLLDNVRQSPSTSRNLDWRRC